LEQALLPDLKADHMLTLQWNGQNLLPQTCVALMGGHALPPNLARLVM